MSVFCLFTTFEYFPAFFRRGTLSLVFISLIPKKLLLIERLWVGLGCVRCATSELKLFFGERPLEGTVRNYLQEF